MCDQCFLINNINYFQRVEMETSFGVPIQAHCRRTSSHITTPFEAIITTVLYTHKTPFFLLPISGTAPTHLSSLHLLQFRHHIPIPVVPLITGYNLSYANTLYSSHHTYSTHPFISRKISPPSQLAIMQHITSHHPLTSPPPSPPAATVITPPSPYIKPPRSAPSSIASQPVPSRSFSCICGMSCDLPRCRWRLGTVCTEPL